MRINPVHWRGSQYIGSTFYLSRVQTGENYYVSRYLRTGRHRIVDCCCNMAGGLAW